MAERSPGATGSGFRDMQGPVVAHYEQQLARHGATARGMDWKDARSQRLRFEILAGVGDLDGRTLCDVGAGAGHLADYLGETGRRVEYCGIDLSPRMVAAARARLPDTRFECHDILGRPLGERWDFVVCSGLFHVKLDADVARWRGFVEATLRAMYRMCRVGIAFNLMGNDVDYRVSQLYYTEAADTLAFCREALGGTVTLRDDYPLYEYTVYVHRRAD